MHIANINEAKTNLSQLIARALAGDEIVIARANQPLVRLEPFIQDTRPRVGGQWAGICKVAENFEFTPAELIELFHAPITSDAQ